MAQQYKISFDEDLRKALDFVSQRNNRPISEEIRERLVKSFEFDFVDPKSARLGEDLGWLATEINLQAGAKWHEDPEVFEALIYAITAWLEAARPSSPKPKTRAEVFDPATLGRTVARMKYQQAAIEARDWRGPFNSLYGMLPRDENEADVKSQKTLKRGRRQTEKDGGEQ
jgi:hypothetical protein